MKKYKKKIIFLSLSLVATILIYCLMSSYKTHCFARSGKSGYTQRGVASWYGKRFHGKKTACGERYDMFKLTAAHRNLPFGTIVKVTNLTNNREIVVRINDRGPYKYKRIIDLSLAAACQLRMVKKGITKVKVEVLSRGI